MTNIIKNTLCILVHNRFNVQQIRFYPRWSHRTPKRVYTPEEYEKLETGNQRRKEESTYNKPAKDVSRNKYADKKIKWVHPIEQVKSTAEVDGNPKPVNYRVKANTRPLVATNQKTKKVNSDMLETVIDEDGNFIYTKMGNKDHRVGTILTEVKSKKEKEKKDLCLLEGKRLIKDALLAGCTLKYLLYSRNNEVEYLKPFLPKLGASLFKMPYREMQMWSDVTTSPGIMGIFKVPDVSKFIVKESIPFTIICDNIREPGNLGSVLRICAGVGCERVILTKGCVNLWDTKVLRSSAGAHFKLQIHKSLEWSDVEDKLDPEANIYIADNRIISTADSASGTDDLKQIIENVPILPYYGVNFKSEKHTVIIVGGETEGVSTSSYEIASKRNGARLHIPLRNDVESLNVGAALGIIAFEVKRQRVSNNLE